MTNKSIEVSNVSKSFGEIRAINDISLTISKGEIIGLIGHNGAGKSTLFKLMLGLTNASSGQIRICGELIDGADFRKVRRGIGYLPENFITYDNLTGLEVMHFFSDLKNVPRSECGAILEQVGLSHAANRRVVGYSKGMRQRLGFAQCLLGNPGLIFLDEPTNGLDPEGIRDFYSILLDVQSQGATVVITSHILAEIQERVSRLVIMNAGQIAAQGSLCELRSHLVLPSVFQVRLKQDACINFEQAFAQLQDIAIETDLHGLQISCPQQQKLTVLGILSNHAGAIADLTLREPSLEDLFLGCGGHYAKTH